MMQVKSAMKIAILPALGLTFGVSSPVSFAQQGALEEVLVTARKREENLQDVAVAVSVISATTIEDAGLVRLTEIAQLVPNMTNTDSVSNKATKIPCVVSLHPAGLVTIPALECISTRYM